MKVLATRGRVAVIMTSILALALGILIASPPSAHSASSWAPTNVIATSPLVGQIKVEWGKPLGSRTPDEFVMLATNDVTGMTYESLPEEIIKTATGWMFESNDHWVDSGPYTIVVTAIYKTDDVNAPSDSKKLVVNGGASAPRNLSITEPTPNNLRVTWDPPSDNGGEPVEGYTVEFYTSGEYITSCKIDDPNTRECLKRLSSATYTVLVYAKNFNGLGTGVSKTYTIHEATPPSQPGAVKAISPSEGVIVVSWSPPGFDGYAPVTEYTASIVSKSGLSKRCVVKPNVSSCTFSKLSWGLYKAEVYAKNRSGSGSSSKPVSVIVHTRPSAAKSISARADGTTLNVEWDKPQYTGGFAVRYKVIADATQGKFKKDCDTTSKLRKCSLKKMRPGKYKVTVKAINSLGSTSASIKATVSK